jgi:hypothetical protein
MSQARTGPRIAFEPYPEQRAVLESPARFRVVAAGRRSGKTTLAAVETVRRMFDAHGDWLGYWVTPTHDIADTGFRLIDDALPDDVVAERKLSPPREIELVNGARLGFRTVGGGANVSVGLDWLVIDEAAKDIPERAWTQDLRPTLSDTGGEAMFISTPDGRGWFHDWFQRGQSADYATVASFQWATYANPHVPDDEVDAARAELPDRVFEQEYLAQFRDDTGGVFTPRARAYALPDGVAPHPMAVPPFRLGVDLARSEDYLAIVGLDKWGAVSHLTRERDLSWPQIQAQVERVAEAHESPMVAIDATRDNKVVADLEAAGLDIRPVRFTAQRKQALVENLAAGMEQGEVTVPAGSILETELEVFEFETTRAGNVRYGAPQGHHDDTVDALAMAYDLAARGHAATGTARVGDPETGERKRFNDSPLGQAVAEFQDARR